MYVVSGITGNTGRVVAEQLKAAGHKVRAIVRNPEYVPQLGKEGFDTRVVDLGDAKALAGALSGAEGAYLLVPPFFGPEILAHQRRVAEAIAQALKQVKLNRVVLLSSIGAEHAAGTGPILACHHLEEVCASVENVTFIRAGYFLENWLSMAQPILEHGVLPNFLPEDVPLPMVATEDIGRTAAALLLQQTRPERVVQLMGPEALTPRQVASTASAVLAKGVQLATEPLSRLVESFMQGGVPRELAELFLELYQAATDGRLVFEAGPARRGTTSVAQVLRAGLNVG